MANPRDSTISMISGSVSPPAELKSEGSSSQVYVISQGWRGASADYSGVCNLNEGQTGEPAASNGEARNVLMEWMEAEVKNRLVVIDEKLEKLLAEVSDEPYEEARCRKMQTYSSGNEIVVPEGMSEAGLSVVKNVSKRSVIEAPAHVCAELAAELVEKRDTLLSLSELSPKNEKVAGPVGSGLITPPPPPVGRLGSTRQSQTVTAGSTLNAMACVSKMSARASGIVNSMISRDKFSGCLSEELRESSNASPCSSIRPSAVPSSARPSSASGWTLSKQQGSYRWLNKRSLMDQIFSQVGQLLDREHHEEGSWTVFDKIWHFLEDPESGKWAHYFHGLMTILICSTVFWSLLQSVDPPPLDRESAVYLEIGFDCVFALEFILRFVFCPDKCHFFLGAYNLIDLAVACLLIFRCHVGLDVNNQKSFSVDLLHSATPVLRLMKTLRRFQKFHLIFSAFHSALEALPVLLWTLLLTTLMFSALVYLVEPRDNIASLPKAMWLTIVTMTTVGYGDVTPKSATGSMFTAVLIVSSVLYMAMPLAIIGQSFSTIWAERDRILLMQQTRKRLLQWGYTAQDIPVLFSLFDGDGSGELELPEFRSMIKAMRIGLNEERVVELFESFDADGSGTIDDREFVRYIFPKCYQALYDSLHGHGASRTDRSSKISRSSKVSRSSKLSRASKTSKASHISRQRSMKNFQYETSIGGMRSSSDRPAVASDESLTSEGLSAVLPRLDSGEGIPMGRRVSRNSLLLPAGSTAGAAPPTPADPAPVMPGAQQDGSLSMTFEPQLTQASMTLVVPTSGR